MGLSELGPWASFTPQRSKSLSTRWGGRLRSGRLIPPNSEPGPQEPSSVQSRRNTGGCLGTLDPGPAWTALSGTHTPLSVPATAPGSIIRVGRSGGCAASLCRLWQTTDRVSQGPLPLGPGFGRVLGSTSECQALGAPPSDCTACKLLIRQVLELCP